MAATYNGWVAKLYADGVEICSRWAWGPIRMPEAPFTLSGYLTDSGEIVDEISGRLDDVRIYDQALCGKEIRHIMQTDVVRDPAIRVDAASRLDTASFEH